MKKVLGLFVVAMLWVTTAFAQPFPSVNQDPCANPQNFGQITSAAIAVSSATTTKFLTAAGTTSLWFICIFQDAFTEGTAGTMQLEYGTGATCGTGTTALTGVYTNAAAATVVDTVIAGTGAATVLVVPAGNNVCGLSTGTDVQAGFIKAVQITPQ